MTAGVRRLHHRPVFSYIYLTNAQYSFNEPRLAPAPASVRDHSHVFACIRMHPQASECIRMHPYASARIRRHQRTSASHLRILSDSLHTFGSSRQVKAYRIAYRCSLGCILRYR